MPGFKSVVGAVCIATMVTSSAFAASVLAPGKPAGVKQAQVSDGTLLLAGVGVAIVATTAIIVSNQNNTRSQPLNGPSATVTTFLTP